MYSGTGFGAQAKKEQDVEQKKFQIEEKRLALVNQRAVLKKARIRCGVATNNLQKKLQLQTMKRN